MTVCRVTILSFVLLIPLFSNAVFGQETSDSSPAYLFSYFKNNGEAGLQLAYSNDGLKWAAVDNDKIFLKPQVGGKLMRDPSICQDPNGIFHMVWTTGWWDKGIGIAHSNDLINWSEQTFLPVMKHESTAKNCWAPEIYYDHATTTFLICWATTIPGRFPNTKISATIITGCTLSRPKTSRPTVRQNSFMIRVLMLSIPLSLRMNRITAMYFC